MNLITNTQCQYLANVLKRTDEIRKLLGPYTVTEFTFLSFEAVHIRTYAVIERQVIGKDMILCNFLMKVQIIIVMIKVQCKMHLVSTTRNQIAYINSFRTSNGQWWDRCYEHQPEVTRCDFKVTLSICNCKKVVKTFNLWQAPFNNTIQWPAANHNTI